MKGVHGSAYDFVPTTFALPTEYVKFCQYFSEQREAAQSAGATRAPIYICKPSELSRGRKIFVFDDIGDLTYDCSSVVQQYVSNPLLVHGHKADFRIYVLVACFKPLRAYIYTDGLTRMSVEEYTLDDVKNIFAHLTNYSVNKNSENWEKEKAGIGSGCKWDFTKTREYFKSVGADFDVIFDRIECLVCLTLLSISNNVNPVPQCFELYGFDVLFDANFKPWLMEVNFSPALAVESDVDVRVKEPLIWDIVQTLGIQEFPPDPLRDKQFRVAGDADDEEDRTVEGSSPEPSSSSTPPPPAENGASAKRTMPKPASLLPPKPTQATGNKPQPFGGGKRGSAHTAAVGLPKRSNSSVRPGVARSNVTPTTSTASGPSGRLARSNSSVRSRATGPKSSSATDPADALAVTDTKTFYDKPSGQFKACFPFNDAVEDLNRQMANSSTPEKLVRQIITEIRKREAKNIAAIASWKK